MNHKFWLIVSLLAAPYALIGCSPTQVGPSGGSAGGSAGTPEFQQNVRLVVGEVERMKNLVEMGAPKLDREAQIMVLRRSLAGVTAHSSLEQSQRRLLSQLVSRVTSYSYIAGSLASQGDPEAMRGFIASTFIDENKQRLVETKKNLIDCRQEIEQLLTRL